MFGLRFFRSKTSDTGNFSRVQNEVKLIFEKFSVFLMGVITTTERRGRHEIEQSQIGPKGEGVGTSESKKGRARSQRRVWKAEIWDPRAERAVTGEITVPHTARHSKVF